MDYGASQHLTFDLPPRGLVPITTNRSEVLNATNAQRRHWESTHVLNTVDANPRARLALDAG
jgi:hypothetical protein